MNIIIREATNADSPEILSLINNELGYPDLTIEELSSNIAKMKLAGNFYIYVAILSEQIVGFVAVTQEMTLEFQKDFYRIKAMAVSNAYQSNGIGGSLLKHIENIASENDIDLFVLSSSFHRKGAHMFYERNGYSKTSFTFQKGEK